jgi:D-3-phosphoglycerate dehydrogenase
MKVLISTYPFCEVDRQPFNLLQSVGVEFITNPCGRKLTEKELGQLVEDIDVVIAGTEPISDWVMERGQKLKLISRVGVGLDSVDLLAAERRGIPVSYTPDAPTHSVAELTIGLMLSLIRSIHLANISMHGSKWFRYSGRRLETSRIGIIGVGRIGREVLRKLFGFGCRRIMVNDLDREILLPVECLDIVEWVEKEKIFQEADIITLHVPLTKHTRNLVGLEQINMMKNDALLINTARGGIINEEALFHELEAEHLGGAAIDVFSDEPYTGRLSELARCLLTAHMGSMSIDCRARMEIEATEEAVRCLTGMPLQSLVPRSEYEIRRLDN